MCVLVCVRACVRVCIHACVHMTQAEEFVIYSIWTNLALPDYIICGSNQGFTAASC